MPQRRKVIDDFVAFVHVAKLISEATFVYTAVAPAAL